MYREKHSLMVSGVGLTSGGNRSNTVMKLTHATAIIPMGIYHLPRENGPGWSRLRPDVIRRKIGTVYETYSPMTDALVTRYSVNE